MEIGAILGALIAILLGTVFYSFVFWIIAKINLGLEINKFGTAIVAAFLASIIRILLGYVTHDWKGVFSGQGGSTILHIIGTAIVIIIVSRILPGMKTRGLTGALIASVSIGILGWLLGKGLEVVLA